MTNLLSTTMAKTAVTGAFRKLTTAVIAGAVALSVVAGAAAPARADSTSDNVLKGLIALGAVGVIVNSLDKDNDRDRRPRYSHRGPPPPAYWQQDRRGNGWDRGPSRFDRERQFRRDAWRHDRDRRDWRQPRWDR